MVLSMNLYSGYFPPPYGYSPLPVQGYLLIPSLLPVSVLQGLIPRVGVPVVQGVQAGAPGGGTPCIYPPRPVSPSTSRSTDMNAAWAGRPLPVYTPIGIPTLYGNRGYQVVGGVRAWG